jgi:hypothetical protein
MAGLAAGSTRSRMTQRRPGVVRRQHLAWEAARPAAEAAAASVSDIDRISRTADTRSCVLLDKVC